MNIKNIALIAAGAALFASATTVEAARLTIQNLRGHTINLVAIREGHGNPQGFVVGDEHIRMYRGHRAWKEQGRRLDLGHLHAGEWRTFDVDSGNWTVLAETSHRRTESQDVHVNTHGVAVVKFQ